MSSMSGQHGCQNLQARTWTLQCQAGDTSLQAAGQASCAPYNGLSAQSDGKVLLRKTVCAVVTGSEQSSLLCFRGTRRWHGGSGEKRQQRSYLVETSLPDKMATAAAVA